MHLTKLERLMLINQYEILKRMNPQGAEQYDAALEILSKGFKIFYGDVTRFLRNDMSETDGVFVTEVLQMYRLIESYKRDNPQDGEVASDRFGRFAGFDSTHELECMELTNFLIHKRGEWAEQKPYAQETNDFKSAGPMKEVYARMLEVWKSFGQSVVLAGPQIRAILHAAHEPDAQR